MAANSETLPDTAFIGPPMLPDQIEGEAYSHMVKRLLSRKDDLFTALGSSGLYIQLLLIGVACFAGLFIARLIQKRVNDRLAARPPEHIDVEFITKPLSLLGPFMVLSLLLVAKLLSIAIDINSGWVEASMEICTAYLLSRAVLLVVHTKPVAYFISTVIMVVAVCKALHISRSIAAYLNAVAFDAGQYHISLLSLANGIVILVIVFWGASLLSRTLESYLRRSSAMSYNARELTVKCFKLIFYFFALVITLSAVGIDLTAFAVFGGALGVGVGLGLQKLTSNFVSSVTLLMEKSIKIGDLIEVGGYTGWVRQLNIRYALLETFDGREIMIPNEELVSTRITNWTHTTNLASIEVKVSIDFDSDPVLANALMLEAAAQHPLAIQDPAPSCWLREFAPDGLHFVLTFWIADIKAGRTRPQSEVMFAILEKFAKANIRLSRAAP